MFFIVFLSWGALSFCYPLSFFFFPLQTDRRQGSLLAAAIAKVNGTVLKELSFRQLRIWGESPQVRCDVEDPHVQP